MWVYLSHLRRFFSKVCRQYMAKNPGRVVTEDVLASLVGEAFGQSHTPLNIMEHGSVSLCRDGQKTKWRLQCKY